jgi:secreted trypsin-like serine protease
LAIKKFVSIISEVTLWVEARVIILKKRMMMKAPSISILSNLFLLLALSGVSLKCSSASNDIRPTKEARIVNGENSDPSNRSFYVKSSIDRLDYTSDILCGATLIAPDIAITAA